MSTQYPKTYATPTDDGLPAGGLVRLPQILAVLPIGKSTWHAWVASGKAPQPLKLGPRTTVWRVTEIRTFLAELTAGTPDPNALKAAAARKRGVGA